MIHTHGPRFRSEATINFGCKAGLALSFDLPIPLTSLPLIRQRLYPLPTKFHIPAYDPGLLHHARSTFVPFGAEEIRAYGFQSISIDEGPQIKPIAGVVPRILRCGSHIQFPAFCYRSEEGSDDGCKSW